MIKNILLTGKPQTGKTTLLKEIVKDLLSCGGFYTEEIKKDGERIGFKIKTIDGKETILAEKGLKSRYRLGKYGINLKGLEEIGVKTIENALENKELIIIDEIGKMEFFSEKFKEVVLKALNSSKKVLGIIHREYKSLVEQRKDTIVLEVDLHNHQEIFKKCKKFLLENEKKKSCING